MDQDEIQEGIKLCIENAKRLLDDSKLLFDNKRYPASILMSIVSLEESAKAAKLQEYYHDGRDLTKSQWKREGFLSHAKKLEKNMKLRGQAIDRKYPSVRGTYSSDSMAEWFSEEHTKLREAALYVDRDFEASVWISPQIHSWLGDDYWAKYLISAAEESISIISDS